MKLTTGKLLAYAAPTVALQAMLVPLYNFLPPVYYSAEVGMVALTVASLFAVGRFWEAIIDPLVGALSDRTRSRFGRRRIWMLAGAPIALVAAWFLLLPPSGASSFYLLFWLVTFYAGWTMVYVPHQTWGGELSSDYAERNRIAGFRESGAFFGYLCASAVGIFYWIWFKGVAFPSYAQIVQSVGVFFAVALPIAILWCFARVPPAAVHEERTPSWSELIHILTRNAPFRRLIGAYFIDRLAMGVYFGVQPVLISQALGLQQHVLTVAIVNTVAAVLLAPLWVPIANRVGKHRAYCYANVLTAVAYLILFVVPAGVVLPVLLVNVLMAFGNGGTMITPPSMTADAVDSDELQTGVAQMGGHMAFLASVFKFGMGFGLFLGLGFLSLFGYVDMSQVLTPQVEQGVRLGASFLPAFMLLLPVLLMWRYPIDGVRHEQIRAALAARRARQPS
ncbi:MAG: MFS transporter [Gammaproteobacteria bacterium]|nr:MFS transporter [Gammaproteobacteria bacterium]NDF85409.1 MFS transporter [Gammaproteobacteria bacterium]